MDKPWTNPTYQELTQRFLSEKDPIKRKALYYDTRKMRTELKNNYLADQLNFASEQRDTEQEFGMMREQHTSTPRFHRPLIPNQKLERDLHNTFDFGRKRLTHQSSPPCAIPRILETDYVDYVMHSV